MAKSSQKPSSKKAAQNKVVSQLEATFGDLKERLGEKKFNARIKKMSRILTEDLEKIDKKKKTAKSNTVKGVPAAETGVSPEKKNIPAPPVKKEVVAKKTAARKTTTAKAKN